MNDKTDPRSHTPGKVGRDALGTLVFQGFGLAAGVVTNMVIARTLGPEGKGVLSFLAYTLFVATSLAAFGLQASAIQQIGKRLFHSGTVATAQLILGFAFGLVAAIVVALVLPGFEERIGFPHEIIYLFLPIVILALIRLNISGILIGSGRIRTLNILSTLTPAFWVTGAIIVLLVLSLGTTETIITWICAQGLAATLMIVWVLRVFPPRLGSIGRCLRASMRFGTEAYFANLIWALLLRIDGFLLAHFWAAEQIGYYSVSVLLAEMLWYLSRSLTMALSPRISAGTPTEALSLTIRAARMDLWIVAAGAVTIAALATPLIGLVFGEAFLPAVRPLWLILPGILGGAIASPISLYFIQQKGRPRVPALFSGIALTVNIVLNLILIPKHGPSGAAIASTVAYLLVAILLTGWVSREPGFSWRALLLPRAEDVRTILDLLRGLLRGRNGR